MKTTVTFLRLLTVILPFMFSSYIRAQGIDTQDSLALVDLYNKTGGPQWFKHTNWLTSKPVNSWFGITTHSPG